MLSKASWIAPVFLALALAQLIPVWAAPYYPTSDGPSHLYNAFVMRELVLHRGGPIAQTYAIDWRPHPNVLGHVALAILLGLFPAAVAEKLLVSAIVLLFLAGAWMLADGRAYAFLALPLAHHELLQYGFYNYSLSAGIYLVTLALWWRRRDRPDWQTIALIALMILLCYTAHPSSTLLLMGSIGLLWLMTSRDFRHLLAFVPVLPLLAWFFLQQRHAAIGGRPPFAQRLVALARLEILQTFDGVQLTLGKALMGLLAVLIVVTILVERRRRDEDAFLALTAAVVILFFVAPNDAAGGQFVSERLAVLIPLLPLPWLTPRFPRWPLLVALSIVAVANALFLTKQERAIARHTVAFVRAERAIPAEASVLALNGQRYPGGTFLPLLTHASGYTAIERRLVDIDNYEANTGYFPVRRRAGPINVLPAEGDPANLDIDPFVPLAQYVFVWYLPDSAPVLARLARRYELLEISPEARIYRRRAGRPPALDEVLLPIAGTAHPIDGLSERWSVEQTIANRGATPIDVSLSACTGGPCDFVLAPGETHRIAAEPEHPFLIARIPTSSNVAFQTVVQRDGYDGSRSRLAIPAMPLASFPRRAIEIPAAPLTGRVRLHLWALGATELDLVAYDNRKEMKRQKIRVQSDGAFNGDLPQLLAPLHGRVRVRIDAGSDDVRIWGFASDADHLYLPLSSRKQ